MHKAGKALQVNELRQNASCTFDRGLDGRLSTTTFQDHLPAFSAAQLQGLLSCSHVSHSKGGGAHLFLCILACRRSLVRKLPMMLSLPLSALCLTWALCTDPSPSSISMLVSLSVQLDAEVELMSFADFWYLSGLSERLEFIDRLLFVSRLSGKVGGGLWRCKKARRGIDARKEEGGKLVLFAGVQPQVRIS
jgi:hypothetical protein